MWVFNASENKDLYFCRSAEVSFLCQPDIDLSRFSPAVYPVAIQAAMLLSEIKIRNDTPNYQTLVMCHEFQTQVQVPEYIWSDFESC